MAKATGKKNRSESGGVIIMSRPESIHVIFDEKEVEISLPSGEVHEYKREPAPTYPRFPGA